MHKYINCRTYKNYTPDIFLHELSNAGFLNYENFDDIDLAYSDFSDKLIAIINKIAPFGKNRIKNNSEEWFDREVFQAIQLRNKLLSKFKKNKSNLNERLYKESKCIVQDLIMNKKKTFFENKLNENIGKPKDLWKTLKDLGLKMKNNPATSICLKTGDTITFDAKENAENFKEFYSKLAESLLEKLPPAPKRYGKEYLTNFIRRAIVKLTILSFPKFHRKTF